MSKINSYLTFNGNCREAMSFYQECLGGELSFQTIGDSPMADKMPAEIREHILHSTLTRDELILMGSDMVSGRGLIRGNAVAMMLDCSSQDEIRTTYAKLSEGGQATHPLEDSFWGALFGDLIDKYGNSWLLHYER